jgi:hypothetical protein
MISSSTELCVVLHKGPLQKWTMHKPKWFICSCTLLALVKPLSIKCYSQKTQVSTFSAKAFPIVSGTSTTLPMDHSHTSTTPCDTPSECLQLLSSFTSFPPLDSGIL